MPEPEESMPVPPCKPKPSTNGSGASEVGVEPEEFVLNSASAPNLSTNTTGGHFGFVESLHIEYQRLRDYFVNSPANSPANSLSTIVKGGGCVNGLFGGGKIPDGLSQDYDFFAGKFSVLLVLETTVINISNLGALPDEDHDDDHASLDANDEQYAAKTPEHVQAAFGHDLDDTEDGFGDLASATGGFFFPTPSPSFEQ